MGELTPLLLLELLLVQSERIFIKLKLLEPVITLLVLQVQQIALLGLVLDCGLAALLGLVYLNVLHLILLLNHEALFVSISLQNGLLLHHLVSCLVHCVELGHMLVVPLFCCLFEPLKETNSLLLCLGEGLEFPILFVLNRRLVDVHDLLDVPILLINLLI